MKIFGILALVLSLSIVGYLLKRQAESTPELSDMTKEMAAYQQEIDAAGSIRDLPSQVRTQLEGVNQRPAH